MNIHQSSATEDSSSGSWFEITSCQGRVRNCPHVLLSPDNLIISIRSLLEQNFRSVLASAGKTLIVHPHKRLRIAIACCPNACSQPQIMDFGFIACCQMQSEADPELCTGCNHCVHICREHAIVPEKSFTITSEVCAGCGECLSICKPKARIALKKGWRVLAGGKLGRHPRLAREIAAFRSDEQAVAIIRQCMNWFVKNKIKSERFSDTLSRIGHHFLQQYIS